MITNKEIKCKRPNPQWHIGQCCTSAHLSVSWEPLMDI